MNSCIKLTDIYTIADFWKTMNYLPSASDLHSATINIDGKKMIAYSLFKNDITPEWEHPTNKNGSEWGCREHLSCASFSQIWNTLILSFVNNELDHVVGIRCINKTNKNRIIHKIEIWMDSIDPKCCMSVKNTLNDLVPNCPHFTFMKHEHKQIQAQEYNKSRKPTQKKFKS